MELFLNHSSLVSVLFHRFSERDYSFVLVRFIIFFPSFFVNLVLFYLLSAKFSFLNIVWILIEQVIDRVIIARYMNAKYRLNSFSIVTINLLFKPKFILKFPNAFTIHLLPLGHTFKPVELSELFFDLITLILDKVLYFYLVTHQTIHCFLQEFFYLFRIIALVNTIDN